MQASFTVTGCDRCGKEEKIAARQLDHHRFESTFPDGWKTVDGKQLCRMCIAEHAEFMRGRKPAP